MNAWWLKLPLIGGLILVLALPLRLLRGLVGERAARADEVAAEIARSSSRPQILTGPFLLLETECVFRTERRVTEGGQERTVTEDRREPSTLAIAPDMLKIEGVLRTERRSRGIFSTVLYHAGLKATGRIGVPSPPPLMAERVGYRILAARIVLGLGDARGVEQIRVNLGGRDLAVEPGSTLPWLREAVHSPLPADMLQPRWLEFTVDLDLTGTESVAVVPLGGDNEVTLRSDWRHPGFTGSYLPASHRIDASGFRATWKVSRLASQAQQRLAECGTVSASCPTLFETALQTRLIEPVDRYLKTDRAMKYSLVILILVFGAVFFIEVLRRVRVHPMQYGLTGLAAAMFFLLLLSLAEHVGFGVAYVLAAGSCVALISSYMVGVLEGALAGWGFGGLLGGLYALLYGVLQSEDYALLMGTLTLFAVLTLVMMATRRLDWYGYRDTATPR
jgi:inner membrane protein